MKEQWNDVVGYEGLYQISSFGMVKALERSVDKGKCHRTWNEHILKSAEDQKGYLRVSLSKQGKSKTFKVHRLVAEAFHPNPDNLPQVNHIDGNKKNNNADNLEWISASDNMKHACQNGLKLLNGENNSAAKLTLEDVKYIRKNYQFKHPEYGSAALSKKLGVSQKTINRIVNGSIWKGGDADVKKSKALSAPN